MDAGRSLNDDLSNVLEFRILGPLDVRANGEPVDLGGTKQRALLELLLLHANETVPRDRLIDELWGDQPPETAAYIVQGHVSHLRKTLGRDAIGTHSSGYRLSVLDGQLDLARFERLVDEARGEVPDIAAERLREALVLWRGTALSELEGPIGSAERARIDEEHLVALERRIDADLELARQAELVPELEGLVRRHPLRERFRGQLMLALYRTGRQAEALDVYRAGRRVLDEELGLEPGDDLRLLERAILEHDPAIAGTPALRPRDGLLHRRRRLLVAAATGVLACLGLATFVVLDTTSGPNTIAAPPNSVAVIDAANGKSAGSVAVGVNPQAVAVGNGSVWVANTADETISRIDARTRRLVRTIPVGEYPSDVALAEGSAWIALGALQEVKRISPERNQAEDGFPALPPFGMRNIICARTSTSLTSKGGALWLACHNDLTSGTSDATRVDLARMGVIEVPDALTVTSPVDVKLTDLALGLGSIWYVNTAGNAVAQVNEQTLQKQRDVSVGRAPVAVAVGFGSAWIANSGDATVSRVSPGRSDQGVTLKTILAGDEPVDVATGRTAVWVACRGSRTVVEIDPDTNKVVKTFAFENEPARLAAGGDLLWLTVREAAAA